MSDQAGVSAKVTVDVQVASAVTSVPDQATIQCWIQDAVRAIDPERVCEVSVRIVDEDEGRSLNQRYRGKDYATNVLAFPGTDSLHHLPPELPRILGDIVVCGPVVEREAEHQHKAVVDHWAHLLIHGTLHMLGHDHESDDEAGKMEKIETRLLEQYGIRDPYSA